MPEQQGGKTEAEIVEDTGPHAGKDEAPQDKKEETAQEKAISLSMVSLVAAAETLGGFGPFSDTQVKLFRRQERLCTSPDMDCTYT